MKLKRLIEMADYARDHGHPEIAISCIELIYEEFDKGRAEQLSMVPRNGEKFEEPRRPLLYVVK